VQLDQNIERPDSKTPLVENQNMDKAISTSAFAKKYMGIPFQGGFNIEYVKDAKGNLMKYTINQTMMRIDLPKPLKNGEKVSFSSIKEAQNAGIAIIHQELTLVKELSILENIFLGSESRVSKYGILDFSQMYEETSKLLKIVKLNAFKV
jgi:hypothetical protein